MNDNPIILRASMRFFCIPLLLSAQMLVAADRDAALECVNIVSADERLACFDAAYAVQPQIPAAASDTPVVAPLVPAAAVVPVANAVNEPPKAVKTATEEEFGLPQSATQVATEEEFGLPQSQAEILKSPITSVDTDAVGRLTFHLENGQTWKQIETKRFRIIEDRPVAVIRHGALGSFKLSVEGRSGATRVKRIN